MQSLPEDTFNERGDCEKMSEICYICDKKLHNFMTTPLLELPDGSHRQCCEECADKEFPEWHDDE